MSINTERWRRAAIGTAMAAALPFTVAACAEDEPVDENIVEEDGGTGDTGGTGDDELLEEEGGGEG